MCSRPTAGLCSEIWLFQVSTLPQRHVYVWVKPFLQKHLAGCSEVYTGDKTEGTGCVDKAVEGQRVRDVACLGP